MTMTKAETALLILAKALVTADGSTVCEVTSDVRGGVAYAYSVERVGEGRRSLFKVVAMVYPSGLAYVNSNPVDIGFGVAPLRTPLDPKTDDERVRMAQAHRIVRALGFTPWADAAYIDATGAALCGSVEDWMAHGSPTKKAFVRVELDGEVRVRGA
jgi:hypothetical protein